MLVVSWAGGLSIDSADSQQQFGSGVCSVGGCGASVVRGSDPVQHHRQSDGNDVRAQDGVGRCVCTRRRRQQPAEALPRLHQAHRPVLHLPRRARTPPQSHPLTTRRRPVYQISCDLSRNVRRILDGGVSAPLPPEAKKILKI